MMREPQNSVEAKEALIAQVIEHLKQYPDLPRERKVREQYIEAAFADPLKLWGVTAAEICYRETRPLND
jgi:hypothetical protein